MNVSSYFRRYYLSNRRDFPNRFIGRQNIPYMLNEFEFTFYRVFLWTAKLIKLRKFLKTNEMNRRRSFG